MRARLAALLLALAGCGDRGSEEFHEGPTKFRVVRESLYNRVVVQREGDVVELRFRSGHRVPRQTAVDLADPTRLVLPYTRAMLAAAFVQPGPRRVLQIGLGGGAINRYLRAVLPETELTTVELDATVRDMAVEFMDYRPDGNDRVVIEDGRAFVRRAAETWDWILVDAYAGSAVPAHLKTQEFYRLLLARLAPGGVVALNLHAGTDLFVSDLATLRSVFPRVEVFAVPGTGNAVVLAFADGVFSVRLPADFPDTLRRDLTAVAGNHGGPAPVTEAPILTDDFAPAEFLQERAR
jgi:spermidine synthase